METAPTSSFRFLSVSLAHWFCRVVQRLQSGWRRTRGGLFIVAIQLYHYFDLLDQNTDSSVCVFNHQIVYWRFWLLSITIKVPHIYSTVR